MIKAILNGCNGRMGQVLTSLIENLPDMEVAAGIDIVQGINVYPQFSSIDKCDIPADVIIDFSTPKVLHEVVEMAVRRKSPIVIATTGLSEQNLELLKNASSEIPIFRSANMSLGINLVQQLLQSATKVLGDRYDIEIVEKHHKLKKDAPSGTALLLAESINAVRTQKLRYEFGRSGADSLRKTDELGIHSLRGGTIVGEHEVSFNGQDEVISISHQAFSRQVFATGALAAARYIIHQKPGFYTMQDMINESSAVTTLYTYPHESLVSLENIPRDMQLISELYGSLANNDIFIDMISHTGSVNGHQSLSFSIEGKDHSKTEAILFEFSKIHAGIKYALAKNMTKVTVEGPGMEFQSGVAYRVFSSMAKVGISILAVTTSESKISYIISEDEVSKAVSIIKTEFNI